MKLSIAGLPEEDLVAIMNELEKLETHYRNMEILLYGATGFIGKWLTAGLLYSDNKLGLNLKIKIVTRNSSVASSIFKDALSKHEIIQHDLSGELALKAITADIIFHAATPSRSSTGSRDHERLIQSTINAAKHAGETRSRSLFRPQVVHLNSGAIYGNQRTPLRSEFDKPLDSNLTPYQKSKIQADAILLQAKNLGLIDFKSPRLFAFAGPHLPLEEHFAFGNFVYDGLQKKKIEVKGNPNTTRSYMHPCDLIRLLANLPALQSDLPINIGSDIPITISDLAQLVDEKTSRKGVEFLNPLAEENHYVPDTSNLKKLIKLELIYDLERLLDQWLEWLRVRNQ